VRNVHFGRKKSDRHPTDWKPIYHSFLIFSAIPTGSDGGALWDTTNNLARYKSGLVSYKDIILALSTMATLLCQFIFLAGLVEEDLTYEDEKGPRNVNGMRFIRLKDNIRCIKSQEVQIDV
jgi:hypothetical protein